MDAVDDVHFSRYYHSYDYHSYDNHSYDYHFYDKHSYDYDTDYPYHHFLDDIHFICTDDDQSADYPGHRSCQRYIGIYTRRPHEHPNNRKSHFVPNVAEHFKPRGERDMHRRVMYEQWNEGCDDRTSMRIRPRCTDFRRSLDDGPSSGFHVCAALV